MNDDQDRQQDRPKKTEKVNSKLDQAASKASEPDISYGTVPGYVQDHVEEDAQAIADHEGVKLYRNPDGSHEAVDESKMAPETNTDN